MERLFLHSSTPIIKAVKANYSGISSLLEQLLCYRCYYFCKALIVFNILGYIYTAPQKHKYTSLHTYVLNEFLTADHSFTTKYL